MVSSLVDGRLDACRKAVIIDVHSYPPLPLAYELHPDTPRPELCIGADRFHTDSALLEAVSHAFDGFGEHCVDEPFAGSYVRSPITERIIECPRSCSRSAETPTPTRSRGRPT
jgi:N-formylglutamate deformylase